MTLFNANTPDLPCRIPDGTFLLGYRGSVAHAMHIPSSDPNSIDDVDLMGFVVGGPEHYFGLKEWGSRGTKEYWEGKYDCVFYEARKAVSLLLQGNPNIVSMLWLRPEHYIYRSPEANLLIQNRHLFVGKHVYNSFAGYAAGQLARMESREPQELRRYLAITAELKYRGAHPNHKGECFERHADWRKDGICSEVSATSTEKLLQRLTSYHKKGENLGYMGDKRKQLVLEHGFDCKNSAHCIRLLRMCVEFLKTGEMTVYRTADADELLDIKRGKWPLERVKAHAEELFQAAKDARDASTLPEQPDRDGAERILVQIVKSRLGLISDVA
jgi:predicted nucleotidyltransferase